MATLYRDMLVTEFLGWAKQHDLPARLDALLANVATPDLVKSLCRVGKAFCEETQIKTFDADKVLSLANNASLAGIITSDEKTSLLAIIAFDPDEEKLKEVADHVVARQDEVAAYQVNIDNYTAMLTILDGELPEEWPSNLTKWKGVDPMAVYKEAPEADVDLITDLAHRDRLRMLQRGEKGEQRKAQLVLAQLLAKLPSDRRTAMVEAARARQQTRKVSG
mgnify:FL=1